MMPTNDNRMELIVVDLRKYWIAFICTCLVFSLGEGRSLHKNFNPMVIRRHTELCELRPEERTYFHIIFAPWAWEHCFLSNKCI